jgi:hypothetical protein
MSLYMGLNRRSVGDRRVLDYGGDNVRSGGDRRRHRSGRYVLVLGDAGIDSFGLMVGVPVALLLAVAAISAFVRH